MDIKQTKYILTNAPKDKSVMLHAKHGVGKSSVVKQVAQEQGIGFYDLRLSQCEVGDIKGLPYNHTNENGTTVVRFAKPEWFPTDMNSKGILFLDELNRASKDVLQAVFELCLDRRLDGQKIPDGWQIVSAVNSDDDYDVVEFDPALADRWFHIDFDPTVLEWISYAEQKGIHQSVIQFITRNQNLLDPPVGNLEAGRVYPSRRSWESFSDCLISMDLLHDDSGILTQVTKGWVGREIAIMFQKFIQNEFSLLRAEDVLDNFPKFKKDILKSCEDIEVIATLAKQVVNEANNRGAKDFTNKQKENLKKFFLILPSDVTSDTWVGLLGGQKTKKLSLEWADDEDVKMKVNEVFLS